MTAGIRRELDQVRTDVADLRVDLHDLRGRVDALGERVARIEGALTGPWRAPANGGSPPVSTPEADA